MCRVQRMIVLSVCCDFFQQALFYANYAYFGYVYKFSRSCKVLSVFWANSGIFWFDSSVVNDSFLVQFNCVKWYQKIYFLINLEFFGSEWLILNYEEFAIYWDLSLQYVLKSFLIKFFRTRPWSNSNLSAVVAVLFKNLYNGQLNVFDNRKQFIIAIDFKKIVRNRDKEADKGAVYSCSTNKM